MQGDNNNNLLSRDSAEKLLAAHDGDIALLYLYLQCRSDSDLERAAMELCRTMKEMTAAHEKLERMGLLKASPTPDSKADVSARVQASVGDKLPPADELPEYTAEEVSRRSKGDVRFSAVINEAQKIMGHTLSGIDMKTLFGIYDYLAMPTEVILELLNYCAEVFREKYGEERRPSTRAIEKEAYSWANREILTLEQAEEYIASRKAHTEAAAKIAAVIGIRGRELVSTERKFIDSWLSLGFGADEIAIAYDRTVTKTGSLKWNYMNSILLSWDKKGLHSAAEIEKNDVRRSPSSGAAAPKKPSTVVIADPGKI